MTPDAATAPVPVTTQREGADVAESPSPSRRREQAQRYEITAVANALAILGAAAEQDVLSLTDVAKVASVSKSTAYRLLATLEVAGLVEPHPDSGYRAGLEAIRWARRLVERLEIRSVSLPVLRRLSQVTGETVNLAVFRGDELVYVEILPSPDPFRMEDEPGVSVPIHATALGKAVAVHLAPDRLARALGPEPYTRFTSKTATTLTEFNWALEQTRSDGFGRDIEESVAGAACVGVAIIADGEVAGAISIAAPRARMSDSQLEEAGHLLLDAAGEISDRLGARP